MGSSISCDNTETVSEKENDEWVMIEKIRTTSDAATVLDINQLNEEQHMIIMKLASHFEAMKLNVALEIICHVMQECNWQQERAVNALLDGGALHVQENVPEPELKYPNTDQRVELGDHVYRRLIENKLGDHHGIVSEKKLVDNKWCYKVISLYQSGIVEQDLSKFLGNKSKGKCARKFDLQVWNHSEPTQSSKQVVVDAKNYYNKSLLEHEYHLFVWNCESFALECKLGPREDGQPHASTQINKGRNVLLVAGIALVSTVVVLSLPVIAVLPTMGIAALHTIGVSPWFYIVPITIGWCLFAGSCSLIPLLQSYGKYYHSIFKKRVFGSKVVKLL